MAWIDATYLEQSIGTAAVTALGLSGGTLTQYELAARSTVIATMQYAGYAAPGTTIDTASVSGAFLAKLCSALIIRDAYQYRKGVRLPFDPSGTISEGLFLMDSVYNKRLPIPGLEPDTLAGYGGNKGSPIIGTGARPTVFGPGKLGGF